MKLTIVFTLFCCLVIYRLIKKILLSYRQYQILKGVPGPPVESIILGNTSDIMASPKDAPSRARERFGTYGNVILLWILGFPFVFVAGAEQAEVFFNSKSTSVKSDIYRFLHCWLGLGLLTSQGELWKQRRKLITPAFHFTILNSFLHTFVDNTLTLVDKIAECSVEGPVEVIKMMHLVALENICVTAMGIKIDALKNPNMNYVRAIENATHTVMLRISRPWYWNDLIFFLMPIGRQLRKDLDVIFELTGKVIKEKRAERQRKQKENGDSIKQPENEFDEEKRRLAFLDLLLEASESESTPLSDEDIRDEVNTFMFEGHDTTAVSMSFTLYLLGIHTEIQETCYQELESIFQGSDRRPTMDDLQNMKYLEQVIKESLRLYPSVPIIARNVTKDVEIGAYTIPAGTIFSVDIFFLHRDPRYFPDPEKFDPERFSVENSSNRHPYAYVPFAAGPRNCIGQKFAMMEEKVVLSYILRNFVLESMQSEEELKVLFALIIRSQADLNVKFKRRNKQQN